MKVSIIICTCSRAAHLRETLKSLSGVAIPMGMESELIIVDNASTDDTATMAASFKLTNMPLRVLSEPQRGQTHARNTGIGAAEGEIILFTDDDLRLPVDWLEMMCCPISSGKAAGVAGGVALAPHLARPWMEQVHRYWLAETGAYASGEQICMVGANMAFSRTVLGRVPSFDTELGPGALGFADDTLFSKQLWAAGYKIHYADQVRVEHHFQPDRLTRASFLTAARRHGESKAYLAYHWEHRNITVPAIRMAHKRLQIALWRRQNPPDALQTEGLPSGEMYNLEAYHFYRRYLVERRRRPLYEKYGLVKRAGNRK